LAEVGTIQLEFCTLSKLTRNSTYCDKALRIIDQLEKTAKNGVYSTFINYRSNSPYSFSTMGGLGDSFYEYLLKMWIMTGKKIERFQTLYQDAIQVVKNRMIDYSQPNNLLYFKNIYADSDRETHTMEHLACFAGGTSLLLNSLFPQNNF
jgi:mannosyl-oligosaccharide alpha-1,2-mannosidase